MDAVEEVKSRLAIEDVIGEYVPLKRAGRNFRGLSPFNAEKTPSFMVSPEKQIWHDFSSNKGGNLFSFVMEMEGLDFKGALELLARKAGIDLDQYKSRGSRNSGPDKKRLVAASDAAAKFYQVQLGANKEALRYLLVNRNLTKQTVLSWRLGYSPNTGDALLSYLKKTGFSDKEIRQAGLSASRGNRQMDMFRGRIMIPLQDPQGQVIGFTARKLNEQDFGPKYINTPQTPLYDKSRHIFGLHFAKTAIREHNYAVITEGQLDVISSHQAGVKQVVATAGTALTESHLKGLNRFAGDIRLCFDSDKAGVQATERAIGIASRLHLSLNIIELKSGKDPDELIRENPKLWHQAIEEYTYAIDWLIEHFKSSFDLTSANGKRQFTDAILPTITNLEDAVEKDHYLNLIAKQIGVSRQALEDKLARTSSNNQPTLRRKAKVSFELEPKEKIEIAKCEDHLLSIMLKQPNLRPRLATIEPTMLSRDQAKELLTRLKARPDIKESELAKLADLTDYVKIELLQYEELYQGLEQNELEYEAARLQARLVESYVKQQKNNISKELISANESTTQALLERARALDELLRVNLGESHA